MPHLLTSAALSRSVPACQAEALTHIRRVHQQLEGISSQLLKNRDMYSLERAGLAHYDETRLNLFKTSGRRTLTPLAPLLRAREKRWWSRPVERVLLPRSEQEKILEDETVPQPHWGSGEPGRSRQRPRS